MNLTINVPDGSTIRGDQLCTPVSWTSVLTFYLANYVTHVATVQTYPGEFSLDKWLMLFAALLLPGAGVGKGLDRLIRCAFRGKTTLEKAARAGALCMVVRDESWQPNASQDLVDVVPSNGAFPPSRDRRTLNRVSDTLARRMGRSKMDFVLDGDIRNFTQGIGQSLGNHLGLNISFKQLVRHVKPSRGRAKNDAEPLIMEFAQERQSVVRLTTLEVYDPHWQTDNSTWWHYLGVDSNPADGRRITGSVRHETQGVLEPGLPKGYRLAFVPHDARVENLAESFTTFTSHSYKPDDIIVSSSDVVGGVASVIQLLFAIATLYDAVGPQISYFGYAAFGLTVIPYALISFVNLLAALVTPSYSSVYLVSSDGMLEAISRGAVIEGTVGCLVSSPANEKDPLVAIPRSIMRRKPILSTVDDDNEESKEPAIREASARTTCSSVPDRDVELTQASDQSLKGSTRQSILSYSRSGLNQLLDKEYGRDYYDREEDEEVVFVPNHPSFERYRTSDETIVIPEVNIVICMLIGALPLIPLGILTHFDDAQSTYAQRVIIMLWFAMGILYGPFLSITGTNAQSVSQDFRTYLQLARRAAPDASSSWLLKRFKGRTFFIYYLVLLAAPGFAGFAVVGMMYVSFGDCTQIA